MVHSSNKSLPALAQKLEVGARAGKFLEVVMTIYGFIPDLYFIKNKQWNFGIKGIIGRVT
jgi:hypothetical protein